MSSSMQDDAIAVCLDIVTQQDTHLEAAITALLACGFGLDAMRCETLAGTSQRWIAVKHGADWLRVFASRVDYIGDPPERAVVSSDWSRDDLLIALKRRADVAAGYVQEAPP